MNKEILEMARLSGVRPEVVQDHAKSVLNILKTLLGDNVANFTKADMDKAIRIHQYKTEQIFNEIMSNPKEYAKKIAIVLHEESVERQ